MKRLITIGLALVLFLTVVIGVGAQGDLAAAASWVGAQTLADGGLSDGFSEGGSAGVTADAVLAASAAGVDASSWGDTTTPLDFLASQAGVESNTGILAKMILAALSSGQSPADFAGTDLVAALVANYDEATGLYQGIVTDHALAMIALGAADETVPAAATAALVELQDAEGGWAFDGASQADTNTTALAIQALVAAGGDDEPIAGALDYLRGQQNEDGGFPYQTPSDFGTESDANSTASVIQALLATGESLADWGNPETLLASLQSEEGAFQWKAEVAGANMLATVQAIPALAGMTLVDPTVVEAATAPTKMAEPMDETAQETADDAPETLPESGGTLPWMALLAGGLALVAGALLSRRAGHALAVRRQR